MSEECICYTNMHPACRSEVERLRKQVEDVHGLLDRKSAEPRVHPLGHKLSLYGRVEPALRAFGDEVERLRADAMDSASESEMRKQNQGLRERAEQAEAEAGRHRSARKVIEAEVEERREQAKQAEARLAVVVEAAKQLFGSIEIIERQAEVLARRVQDERPVEAILGECKRVRAALILAAQLEEGSCG